MKKISSLLLVIFAFCNIGIAQAEKDFSNEKIAVGVGMGLEYGLLGINASYFLQKNIGVFAGAGYNIAGVGFCAGLKGRLANEGKMIAPYLQGMYGYNAAVNSKIYYGVSLGTGIDMRVGASKKNYFSFGLTYSIRSKEARDAIDSKVSIGDRKPLMSKVPVFPSVGFKIRL